MKTNTIEFNHESDKVKAGIIINGKTLIEMGKYQDEAFDALRACPKETSTFSDILTVKEKHGMETAIYAALLVGVNDKEKQMVISMKMAFEPALNGNGITKATEAIEFILSQNEKQNGESDEDIFFQNLTVLGAFIKLLE